MGAVYEGRHTGTGRRVAVKVITADLAKSPGLVQRFEVEARAGGGIDSQYIAQVLDTGTSDTGAPYIVMEYLVGEDLYQLISRVAPLPTDLALRITAQACLGLEKAHQGKIIHRDIKPANIFLNERDGEIGIKILDFGVAKIRAEEGQIATSLTRTGSLLGSPLYMSPEQARGDKNIDQRSDIWSLGVVLYEQLCSVTPFHEIEGLGSLIIAICGETPLPIQRRAQWVPPEVATILNKALSQKPSDRFGSMYEMYRAIKAVLPGGSTTIEKSMMVPLTSSDRAFAAPPMTSTEPVLSASGPDVLADRVVFRSIAPPPVAPQIVSVPALYHRDPDSEDTELVGVESTMREAGAAALARPALPSDPGAGTLRSAPPTPTPAFEAAATIAYGRNKAAMLSQPPPPMNSGAAVSPSIPPPPMGGYAPAPLPPIAPSPASHERARTTGGVSSEQGKTGTPRSYMPIAIIAAGAVVLSSVSAFLGKVLGSSAAQPAQIVAPMKVEDTPVPIVAPTSIAIAPTATPSVSATVPTPSASASASSLPMAPTTPRPLKSPTGTH
jgi:eukaryotic-like serine/threonine-protein kinase